MSFSLLANTEVCILWIGEDSPLIVRLLMGLAATYLENDEEEKAIETFQRVVATIERTSGPNDEQLALPLAEMGHILLEVERFDEAEAALLRYVVLHSNCLVVYPGSI